MTIEERAKYAQSQHKDESKKKFNPNHIMNFSDWEYGWCQGATEQRAINIDKACKWLKKHLGDGNGTPEFIKAFRKAMED